MQWRPTILAVVAVVLAACDRSDPGTAPTSPTVAPAISDDARGSATDFYWRTPTVPSNPAATGTFDGTALAQLAVEICLLNSSRTACAGPPVARYTSTSSTRIQLNTTSQEYWVAWRTSSSFSTSAFYRVTVFRNAIGVGLTDVDIVSSSSGLAFVDRSQYAGVVRGGSLDIRFRVMQPAVGTSLRISEIESNLGSPGDWVELHNSGAAEIALGGFQIRDNDDTHRHTLPAGTSIPAGGYLVIEESSLGYGLGTADKVRLFSPGGALIDSYEWTAHASTTYGRCPEVTGAFTTTQTATKGAANACAVIPPPPTPPTLQAWPGLSTVQTLGVVNALGGNMSGLVYEGSGSAVRGVLWAAKNGPGTLYRLIWNGTAFASDPANGWNTGKTLRYPNGSGNPDAEGLTFAATPSQGMYVVTERNNDVSATSRNSILRFDISGSGTSLIATHEWNLTGDLPAVGSNTGLEAITWVPDAFLVARGFFDESRNAAYDPALYADHGDGLFFVGVEQNGRVYAYALNHTNGTFTRITSFASGFAGVMGLEFDRELGQLWVACDDGCSGRTSVFDIDGRAGALTQGRFIATRLFSRPSGMSNLNNEGFALATQAECVSGYKPVFWADDAGTSGHALRWGAVTCSPFISP
jgi:hypothetical protein